MGVTLPKPLMTKVEERDGNNIFRVGCTCVNGFRENMEDAHLINLKEDWGFFGIFDGHVNENCSAYLETAWRDALNINPGPMTDERMKELALNIDKEWLDKQQEGGSTGTFFLAHKKKDGSIVHLQVGNVGDSRVIAFSGGECKSLTEDHKPNNEEERNRIILHGGRVENNRVDGSLAISRAFGDRDYKQGSGDQLDQKVIALADVTHLDMSFGNPKDFVVLCCDGVFESNFTNEEVVSFIQGKMETVNDPAEIAGLVCEEAVTRGSRDNVSCMIVQFINGNDMKEKPHLKAVPGPFAAPKSSAFVKMYKEMAVKGKMKVEEALQIRFDEMLQKPDSAEDEEKEAFGNGPPPNLNGQERLEWFLKLYNEVAEKSVGNCRGENIARLTAIQQQMGIPLPVLLALMSSPGDSSELP